MLISRFYLITAVIITVTALPGVRSAYIPMRKIHKKQLIPWFTAGFE